MKHARCSRKNVGSAPLKPQPGSAHVSFGDRETRFSHLAENLKSASNSDTAATTAGDGSIKCTGAPKDGCSEEVLPKTLLQLMHEKDPSGNPIITAIKCLRTVEDIRQFMREVEADIRASPLHIPPLTHDDTMDNINSSLPFLLGHYDPETLELWQEAYPAMNRSQHGNNEK